MLIVINSETKVSVEREGEKEKEKPCYNLGGIFLICSVTANRLYA